MRLNKKGFMMAEVVVVSSVVLIILTTLYISYNKIFSLYETRLRYEDSNLLYSLAYYRDYLVEIPETDSDLTSLDIHNKLSRAFYYLKYAQNNNNHYEMLLTYNSDDTYLKNMKLSDRYNDDVFLIWNHKRNEIDITKVSGTPSYTEYLQHLNNSIDLRDAEYLMILERKYIDKKTGYADGTYKYAYLVLNG